MKARGKFIVLEGAQGSGKTTTCALLGEALRKRNTDGLFGVGGVATVKFPSDHNPVGLLLRDQQTGKVPQLPASLQAGLFLSDMAFCAAEIESYLRGGVSVLCDRYFFTTMAYQRTEGNELLLRQLLLESKLRLPDVLVFFDLPLDVLAQRVYDREHGPEASNDMYDKFPTVEITRTKISALAENYGLVMRELAPRLAMEGVKLLRIREVLNAEEVLAQVLAAI